MVEEIDWKLHTRELIKAKLKKKGYTQAAFAREWGLAYDKVKKVINRREHQLGTGETKAIRKLLCQTLGCTWSELWEPELYQYMVKREIKK